MSWPGHSSGLPATWPAGSSSSGRPGSASPPCSPPRRPPRPTSAGRWSAPGQLRRNATCRTSACTTSSAARCPRRGAHAGRPVAPRAGRRPVARRSAGGRTRHPGRRRRGPRGAAGHGGAAPAAARARRPPVARCADTAGARVRGPSRRPVEGRCRGGIPGVGAGGLGPRPRAHRADRGCCPDPARAHRPRGRTHRPGSLAATRRGAAPALRRQPLPRARAGARGWAARRSALGRRSSSPCPSAIDGCSPTGCPCCPQPAGGRCWPLRSCPGPPGGAGRGRWTGGCWRRRRPAILHRGRRVGRRGRVRPPPAGCRVPGGGRTPPSARCTSCWARWQRTRSSGLITSPSAGSRSMPPWPMRSSRLPSRRPADRDRDGGRPGAGGIAAHPRRGLDDRVRRAVTASEWFVQCGEPADAAAVLTPVLDALPAGSATSEVPSRAPDALGQEVADALVLVRETIRNRTSSPRPRSLPGWPWPSASGCRGLRDGARLEAREAAAVALRAGWRTRWSPPCCSRRRPACPRRAARAVRSLGKAQTDRRVHRL